MRGATERGTLEAYGSHVGREGAARPKEGHDEHQGSRNDPGNEVGRADSWVIFALILAVLFAVSLIATTGPGRTVDRAPAAPAFSVGDQLAGGPATVKRVASPDDGTAWQPIVVNGSVCHQCR